MDPSNKSYQMKGCSYNDCVCACVCAWKPEQFHSYTISSIKASLCQSLWALSWLSALQMVCLSAALPLSVLPLAPVRSPGWDLTWGKPHCFKLCSDAPLHLPKETSSRIMGTQWDTCIQTLSSVGTRGPSDGKRELVVRQRSQGCMITPLMTVGRVMSRVKQSWMLMHSATFTLYMDCLYLHATKACFWYPNFVPLPTDCVFICRICL